MNPCECPAYILAGGRGSRFGSDKALVMREGSPQLLRLRDDLEHEGHSVHVVADDAERYRELGVKCLKDQVPGTGPMSALMTALEHRAGEGSGWMLLLACDQWIWRNEWFLALSRKATRTQSALCFFRDDRDSTRVISNSNQAFQKGPWQPVPALYHTRFMRELRTAFAHGERSLSKVLAACDQVVAGAECDSDPKSWSFNSVEELEHLRQRKY